VLCKAGAHTELRDSSDMTPLIAAVMVRGDCEPRAFVMRVQEGAANCVMELLAAGANTRAAYNGELPLHLASKLGNAQASPCRRGPQCLGCMFTGLFARHILGYPWIFVITFCVVIVCCAAATSNLSPRWSCC
jgi:hypothetical protein